MTSGCGRNNRLGLLQRAEAAKPGEDGTAECLASLPGTSGVFVFEGLLFIELLSKWVESELNWDRSEKRGGM